MFEEQFIGPGRNITDPRVIAAMLHVPRDAFVPADLRDQAYADRALPIGHQQTISQPYIVAFMTEAIRPQASDRVLEIGTGSGYQAAILSTLVREVFSIEIVEPLAQRASKTLKSLGMSNVHVRFGDGHSGWPEQAPFDIIIVTCAPDDIPTPLVQQLKEGGRMIIPVGTHKQSLHLLTRENGELQDEQVLSVRFVPMTGTAQQD